ncbi:hypothetical protein Daus18300_006098 [Diaporthe australafricana]|uniref:Uncharacterized protein n=1 Tax=Diaporthe australafricana TaxID=127596 RepID=A0ABR3WWQ5_9PEZI
MFFDAALLWQPGGDLARRVPAETDKRYKFADEQLPSWSWIGWQGQLDFQGWATANDFVAACSGWIASSRLQTCPVTTWYTSSDAFGAAARRKIDVEWATWRERYKSPANELPQGWTRWKRRDAEILTINPEESRIELQLIAISRGSIPNGLGKNYGYDLEEYNIEQRPDDGELYEYYNVMWVTWKEGIAFREALGRVHKRMWRSLNPSNIDIVLG